MKVLAIILSVYMMVLIAIPCVDRPFEKAIHPAEMSADANHDHENGADHCSPFCTCNCCGNHIVSIEKIMLSEVISFPGKVVFWYPTDVDSNLNNSIWLPPELI